MNATPTGASDARLRAIAIALMSACVVLWGGQFVASRFALRTDLGIADLTAARFLVAGLILAPFFIRRGLSTCAGVGWGRGLVLATCAGVPSVTLMNYGLSLAPAAHGASIQPCVVMLVSFLLARLWFGAPLTRTILGGLALVVAGLIAIAAAGTLDFGPTVLLGDLMFVLAGLGWGLFTSLAQRWKVDPLGATMVVAVPSAVLFAPIYFLLMEPRVFTAPVGVVLFLAVNQGILNGILGTLVWAFGIRVLGARASARFSPMIPVAGVLLGIPALGEIPSALQLAGVAAVVIGILLTARGGPSSTGR